MNFFGSNQQEVPRAIQQTSSTDHQTYPSYKETASLKICLDGDLDFLLSKRPAFVDEFQSALEKECGARLSVGTKITDPVLRIFVYVSDLERLDISENELNKHVAATPSAKNKCLLVMVYSDPEPTVDFPLLSSTSLNGKPFTVALHFTGKSSVTSSEYNKKSVQKLGSALGKIS